MPKTRESFKGVDGEKVSDVALGCLRACLKGGIFTCITHQCCSSLTGKQANSYLFWK